MSCTVPNPKQVYGIDFSGDARNAGKLIWIAQATPTNNTLRIDRCLPATQFLDLASPRRKSVLDKLVEFIATAEHAVFGIDFPFGLPLSKFQGPPALKTWKEYIGEFVPKYPSPEELQKKWKEAAVAKTSGKQKELKRQTDEESKPPFSPYNLRVVKQTYYGMADVLLPLVMQCQINVPPMLCDTGDAPWVMEVCPASTLKYERLYNRPYKCPKGCKGGKQCLREARAGILDRIEEPKRIKLACPQRRESVLDNCGGDALDSVIAADAAYRAVSDPARIRDSERWPYTIEGYIYV